MARGPRGRSFFTASSGPATPQLVRVRLVAPLAAPSVLPGALVGMILGLGVVGGMWWRDAATPAPPARKCPLRPRPHPRSARPRQQPARALSELAAPRALRIARARKFFSKERSGLSTYPVIV